MTRAALQSLENKDVMQIFPAKTSRTSTVLVLKTPKTESSHRRVYLRKSVAELMVRQKAEQEELKKILRKEYHDYGLVLATSYGMPIGSTSIRHRFSKLIKKHDLPEVVFHSLRHTSVTYKLKLNGGDIKAV